jgi:capsular exopolysaccharide synthesis family protein
LNFAASEAYKLLRTNLIFSASFDTECRIIGVTSALRGEGKSTTSLNLAYSLAEGGNKTLFIEADMRIPVVAEVLQIPKEPGLSHLLAGLNDLKEAVKFSGLVDNLAVITAGEIPPNPSEMLSSKRMEQVVEVLSKSFDYIIVDLPPVTAVSDALAVSRLLSGMLVVVRRDYCDQHALAETIRQMELMDVKVLGFVFNGGNSLKSKYKRYSYKYKKSYKYAYGYGYGYGKRPKKIMEVPEEYDVNEIPSYKDSDGKE